MRKKTLSGGERLFEIDPWSQLNCVAPQNILIVVSS